MPPPPGSGLLPENRVLAAGVAKVEREGELVAAAAGAAADGRDRHVGRLRDLQHEVGPHRQLVVPRWGGEVGGGREIEVVGKEVRHRTVEHDDLDVQVVGQLVDDRGEAQDGFPDDEVDGRVVEGDPRDLR